MPTPTHAATGRTELALTVAAAALLPLRLALHYASEPPTSRPMAALVLPHQSRESSHSTRARQELRRSSAALGRVA
jgi:hypothetical protein